MRFVHYINEKSYEEKDIPKKFKVIFDLKSNTINELGKMTLDGVKGISSSGNVIMYNFLGVSRNAMLIMDGKETVVLNKLSRIMYDNPHYGFSNNMAALKRMFSKTDNGNLWQNIGEYVFTELVKQNIVTKHEVEYNVPYSKFPYIKVMKTKKVNSIKDAVKVFKAGLQDIIDNGDSYYTSYLKKVIDLEDRRLENIFKSAYINGIGPIYSDEEEWIVKNSSLKIPKKSILILLLSYKDKYDDIKNGTYIGFDREYIEREIALIDEIKRKLGGKYIIKFVNSKDFEKARSKWFIKRATK